MRSEVQSKGFDETLRLARFGGNTLTLAIALLASLFSGLPPARTQKLEDSGYTLPTQSVCRDFERQPPGIIGQQIAMDIVPFVVAGWSRLPSPSLATVPAASLHCFA